MSRSATTIAALVALLVSLVGCSDRPKVWTAPQSLLGPVVIGQQVVWLERQRGLLFALDADVDAPTVHQLVVGRNAVFVTLTPDKKRLAVLTAGREAIERDQTDEAPALSLIDAGQKGVEPKVARAYRLPAAFDRLSISSDGRFAIAFYDNAKSGVSSGTIFRNPNEVALLDLSAAPAADNPRLRTMRSFGSAPSAVTFSPPTAIPASGGRERTLALLLASGYLTLLEMDNPTRREITVPLAPSGSQATIDPQQIVFAGTTIYVRASGAADLYAVSLEPVKATDPNGNDFRPRINQPSAGRQALDLLLLDGALAGAPGKQLILTVNAEQDLALIDAATSQFSRIPLGEAVDTIVPVPADKPKLALLYNRRAARSRLHFVEIDKLAVNLGANVRSRSMARPVREVIAVPGGAQALVIHDSGRAVVSLVDLVGANRTDTPIAGSLPLRSFGFVGESHLVGVAPGLSRLGLLDLTTLHPVNLRLDHPPQAVLVAGDTVVVDHGGQAGLVTLLRGADAASGDREQGHVVWGFLLSKLLDSRLED